MTNFKRGDVVIVELGVAAKTRPCVIVSIPSPDKERNMSVVVPMTTEVRGGQCEVSFPKPPWLRQNSVVNVLGIAGVDNAKISRRIASFPMDPLKQIEAVMRRTLALENFSAPVPPT
ncbi:MAG: type II toxin-antitoxin system PemK/MazF family toxin [Verrucomicrobiota bacterium]|nr:type II toxin-antitoxin system PemK/MazF family toxin [Verrucomicrobiota bacterium]